MARIKVENHKTAQAILDSAKKHFLQKGFAGTAISDIALEANIHKSLIYHHFKNKENLWKTVKERILEQATGKDLAQFRFNTETLKTFLEDVITFRFNLYASNPELVRLMNWQRLEAQGDMLAGVSKLHFTDLEDEIADLQKRGEIRADLHPAMVNYLILSLASNGFLERVDFLQSELGKAQYLHLIIEMLDQFLHKTSR